MCVGAGGAVPNAALSPFFITMVSDVSLFTRWFNCEEQSPD